MHQIKQTPQQRFDYVQERIRLACDRSNRDPSDITLVGVSKGQSFDHIRQFLDLNLHHLGENYLQEAETKLPFLIQSKPSLKTHFIGHLQTNKVKKVLELFDYIHSVDSIKLVRELDKRCKELLPTNAQKFVQYPIFIEVNLSGDKNKTGCKPEALLPILEFTSSHCTQLDIQGLMVLSPLEMVDETKLHTFFRKANNLLSDIQVDFPSCTKLSMGMSDDFEIAIEEGSTHIRIGTLLFGPRI